MSHGKAKPSPSVKSSPFSYLAFSCSWVFLGGGCPRVTGAGGERRAHRDMFLKGIFNPEAAGNAFTLTMQISNPRQPLGSLSRPWRGRITFSRGFVPAHCQHLCFSCRGGQGPWIWDGEVIFALSDKSDKCQIYLGSC